MFEYLRHLLFQDVLDLRYGQVKFFSEWFKAYTVYKPSLYNRSVAFGEYSLVYDVFDLADCEIAKVNHFLRFTPLLFPYLRLRVRVLVIFAR